MKRLVAYGDSWTGGEGCNREIEDTLSMHEKLIYQKNNSWVSFLSEKLNITFENKGVSGNSNNKIFNLIADDIRNGVTTKDDLVIIMWSSSLRDSLPFFPKLYDKGEWLSWSMKHLIEAPEKFIKSTKSENKFYDFFLEDYKKFFLSNLFSDYYYSIINQNYIIFLQNYFEYYGIKYIMCDGIESMFTGLNPSFDKSNLIKKEYYWECNQNTIQNWLIENSDDSVWEHKERWKDVSNQHPNIKGHKMIAEELNSFISKKLLYL